MAAAGFNVEAEAAGIIAALFGFVGVGEELADVVVEADVGGRVGTRVTADGRLINIGDAADVLDSFECVVVAREGAAVVELVVELFKENLVNQRAFTRTRGAGDADQLTQRDFHVEVF